VIFQNKWVQRVIVWGALIGLYELAALAAGPFYLPQLGPMVAAVGDLWKDGDTKILLTSLLHLLEGSLLAGVIGIVVGLAMGRSRFVDDALGMYVRGLFVTPLVAIVPLLVIFAGVGVEFEISVVFLFCVFFVIVHSATGAKAVPATLVETADAFCVGRLRQFKEVVLPSAMPHIFVGLRLGMANAFGGMITAELVVTQGTGKLLTTLGDNRKLPSFFALVVIITVIAGLASFLIKVAENRLTPWGEASRGGMA
jgi:ABC-type nitrate/sulfonate/bicarbonate transport system permease component